MSKILIVEDEPSMRMGLRDNLEFEGHEVEMAKDGAEGLEKIHASQFDLILLDIMMPKISGLDVCKTIRREGIKTPVIFLTAKGEEIDKVLGLEFGADDYITKPFSIRELSARIKAVLRRAEGPSTGGVSGQVVVGRLTLDFEKYEAFEDGNEIKLSHKEFEVLKYLNEHANELVSRYELLERVWGYESQPTTRTVDNFILKIRQKVEENYNEPKVILTVHGAGYKLISGS